MDVYDVASRLIYTGPVVDVLPNNELELDLSFLSGGVYTLVINGRDRCYGRVVVAEP